MTFREINRRPLMPDCYRSSCLARLVQYRLHIRGSQQSAPSHNVRRACPTKMVAGRKQNGLTVRRKPLIGNRSCGGPHLVLATSLNQGLTLTISVRLGDRISDRKSVV